MAILLDAVCILLILFTPLSYLSLYTRLFIFRSSNGISITAALLLALCAQSQIATMYYLWACPPFKRDGGVVPKPPLSIDYINLVQLLVQWICALLLLAIVLIVRTRAQTESSDPSTLTIETVEFDSASPSSKTAVTLLIIHASLCIFWAILAGQPRDDWLDLPFVTIMGINQFCINPIITVATGVASALQINAAKATEGPSALTRTSLLLQTVVFLALTLSWPFRFKVPSNLRYRGSMWFLQEWYPLVGWTCINNAIIAFGQGVALYAATGFVTSGAGAAEERERLLTT